MRNIIYQKQLHFAISRALLSRSGKRSVRTIINTWSSAPVQFWDWVVESAIPAIEGKQVNRTRQATILRFYCHIMGITTRYHSDGRIPVAREFLRENFRVKQATCLGNSGTRLELFSYQCQKIGHTKNKSYAVWPTDNLLSIYNQPGERVTLKKYLTMRKFPSNVIKNIETDFRPLNQNRISNLMRKSTIKAISQFYSHTHPPKEPFTTISGTHIDQNREIPYSPLTISDFTLCDKNGKSTIDFSRLFPPIPTDLDHSIAVDLKAAYMVLHSFPKKKQPLLRGPLDYIARKTRDGHYTPRYRTDNSYCGRLFEHGQGIQGMKKKIRAALLKPAQDRGELINYDVKKCQASILSLLFDFYGIDTSFLDSLITNFDDICTELDIDPDRMKTAIYAPLNGGSHRMENRGSVNAVGKEFMEYYGRELAEKKLAVIKEYLAPLCQDVDILTQMLLEGVTIQKGTKFEPHQFCGTLLTTIEQQFIHCLVPMLESRGIAVLNLQHDGIITSGTIPDDLVKLAGELTGFTNAEMVVKPFE